LATFPALFADFFTDVLAFLTAVVAFLVMRAIGWSSGLGVGPGVSSSVKGEA
jgi:hypothetical protein